MTTFDQLRHVCENADLVEAVIASNGAVCRRLSEERFVYRFAAGRAATAEGAMRALRAIPPAELDELFDRDVEALTGLPLMDASAARRE
jgi:hypothetical protein